MYLFLYYFEGKKIKMIKTKISTYLSRKNIYHQWIFKKRVNNKVYTSFNGKLKLQTMSDAYEN